MADREQDPNKDPNAEETQREQERALHRAQLEAVRSAFQPEGEATPPGDAPPGDADPDDAARTEYLLFRLREELRRLDRRQRNTARVAGALAVSVAVGALAFIWVLPGVQPPGTPDEISVRSIRADRVAVTGDLRLLDAAGNELAVLGREFAAADARKARGPVVLTLNAEGDPSRQLLRFAASKAGAGLTLEAPAGGSSVSLLSTQSGSTVELRNGQQTQRLVGAPVSELAPVGAGPKTTDPTLRAEAEVSAWSPPREGGAPSSDIPELREVGHGFLVADLSTQPAARGVEVRGRMVNTTAVVHNGLAFKISLGGASATVTVPKISPGNSTGFRVVLPDAAVDQPGAATVEYLGSTVAFQATSTEPIYGRRVERK